MAQPKLPDAATIAAMIPDSTLAQFAPMKDYWTKILRINDEQIAVNRFKWHNLPPELSGNLIERILYYRGRGALLFIGELEKWVFLPYALNGSIDMYGRYESITPLPFMGKDEERKDNGRIGVILSTQTRQPVYDIPSGTGLDISPKEFMDSKCVLLYDYTPQLSQYILPRQSLNDGIISMEANIPCYVNTLLSNATGITGVRVGGEDEAASVQRASDAMQLAALNGKRFMSMTGLMEWQDLSTVASLRAEDMLLSMQSFDNMRLSTYGVDNGGIFEKKAHLLAAEQSMNAAPTSLIMEDGLYQRQKFCDTVNLGVLAPLGVPPELWWDCTIAEEEIAQDQNLDGQLGGEGNTDHEPTGAQKASAADTTTSTGENE